MPDKQRSAKSGRFVDGLMELAQHAEGLPKHRAALHVYLSDQLWAIANVEKWARCTVAPKLTAR